MLYYTILYYIILYYIILYYIFCIIKTSARSITVSNTTCYFILHVCCQCSFTTVR